MPRQLSSSLPVKEVQAQRRGARGDASHHPSVVPVPYTLSERSSITPPTSVPVSRSASGSATVAESSRSTAATNMRASTPLPVGENSLWLATCSSESAPALPTKSRKKKKKASRKEPFVDDLSFTVPEPRTVEDLDHMAPSDTQSRLAASNQQAVQRLTVFKMEDSVYTTNTGTWPLRGPPSRGTSAIEYLHRPREDDPDRPHLPFVPLRREFTGDLLGGFFWREKRDDMLKSRIEERSGVRYYRVAFAYQWHQLDIILSWAIKALEEVVYPPSVRGKIKYNTPSSSKGPSFINWIREPELAMKLARKGYLALVEMLGMVSMLIALLRSQVGPSDLWKLKLLDFRAKAGLYFEAHIVDHLASSVVCDYTEPRAGCFIDQSRASPFFRYHMRAMELARVPIWVRWLYSPSDFFLPVYREESVLARWKPTDSQIAGAKEVVWLNDYELAVLAEAHAIKARKALAGDAEDDGIDPSDAFFEDDGRPLLPVTTNWGALYDGKPIFPLHRLEKSSAQLIGHYFNERLQYNTTALNALSFVEKQTHFKNSVFVTDQRKKMQNPWLPGARAYQWYKDATARWVSSEILPTEVQQAFDNWAPDCWWYDRMTNSFEFGHIFRVPAHLRVVDRDYSAGRVTHIHYYDHLTPQSLTHDSIIPPPDPMHIPMVHKFSSVLATFGRRKSAGPIPPGSDEPMPDTHESAESLPGVDLDITLEGILESSSIPEACDLEEIDPSFVPANDVPDLDLRAKITDEQYADSLSAQFSQFDIKDSETVVSLNLHPRTQRWLLKDLPTHGEAAEDVLVLSKLWFGLKMTRSCYDHDWSPPFGYVKSPKQVLHLFGAQFESFADRDRDPEDRLQMQSIAMDQEAHVLQDLIDFMDRLVALGRWLEVNKSADISLASEWMQSNGLGPGVWNLVPSCALATRNDLCPGLEIFDVQVATQLPHSEDPVHNWASEDVWLVRFKDEYRHGAAPNYWIAIYEPLWLCRILFTPPFSCYHESSLLEYLVDYGARVATPAPKSQQPLLNAADYLVSERIKRQSTLPGLREYGHVFGPADFNQWQDHLAQSFQDHAFARAVVMAGGWLGSMGKSFAPLDWTLEGPSLLSLQIPIGKKFVIRGTDEELFDDAFEWQQLYPITGAYVVTPAPEHARKDRNMWPVHSFFPKPSIAAYHHASWPCFTHAEAARRRETYEWYTNPSSFQQPLSTNAWRKAPAFKGNPDRGRSYASSAAAWAARKFAEEAFGPPASVFVPSSA